MPGKLAFLPLASAVGTLFCIQVLNSGELLRGQKPAKLLSTYGQRPLAPDKCHVLERPEGLQKAGQDLWCDELIPRYDMAQWIRQHGKVAPDHPAVFVNTKSHEAEVFEDPDAFLAQYGAERIWARPEYMAAGGHLMDPGAQGVINVSFRRLAKIWDSGHLYFSDFKCLSGSVCAQVAKQFGQPDLFRNPQHVFSRNFLVGGMGSGLPFHKHGATWQGLSMGRKAWYIIPPGSMSEAMHNVTGPYMFPARAFHGALLHEPVGKRPLYCVQHAGEVVFLPAAWWHATMNLDGFQLAYGEKPILGTQQNSDALAKIMRVFPPVSWDSAGSSEAAAATEGQPMMVYAAQPKYDEFFKTCGSNSNDLDQILKWMVESSTNPALSCGLAEVAAWAHCRMADQVRNMRWGHGCEPKLPRSRTLELEQQAEAWKTSARELSRALTEKESRSCAI